MVDEDARFQSDRWEMAPWYSFNVISLITNEGDWAPFHTLKGYGNFFLYEFYMSFAHFSTGFDLFLFNTLKFFIYQGN